MSNVNQQNEILLERAKSAMLSRDYALASRLYKGLLQSEPHNLELLNSLADAYVKSGSDSQAIPLYNEIIRLGSNKVQAMNELGAIYRRLKRYDESIAVLERAIIEDENNIQTFYNLGFTYKLMGKYNDALICFKRVVDENPSDVLAYNHLGSIYAMQKNHSAAIDAYQLGLKVDANHPVLHLNLAKSYEAKGEWEKAAKEFETALRSKPGWVDAIDDYADLLIETNRTKDAGDLVKQAIQINPQNKNMHTKLGKVYASQSKYEDAEKEFTEVLRLDSDDRKALSALADTYEAQGKNADAVKTMRHMELLSPDDEDMLKQFSGILLTAEKLNAASQRIKKIFDRNPDDVEILNLLGQYYICTGDEQKAKGCFKKIDSLDPSYTVHFRDGAKRYQQKGDAKKAEEFLYSYTQKNPEDTIALTLLASVYENQNKLAEALKCYKQIANADSENVASRNGIQRVNRRILSANSGLSSDDIDLNSLLDDSGDVDFDIDIAPSFAPNEDDDLALPETKIEQTVEPERDEIDELLGESERADFIKADEFNDSSVDALDANALDQEQDEINSAHDSEALESLADSDIDDDSIENALDDFMLANSDNSVSSDNSPLEGDMDIGFEEEELDTPESDAFVFEEPAAEEIEPPVRKAEPEPEPEFEEESLAEEDAPFEEEIIPEPEEETLSLEEDIAPSEDETALGEEEISSDEEENDSEEEPIVLEEPDVSDLPAETALTELEQADVAQNTEESFEEPLFSDDYNSKVCSLFKKLKELCQYLPPDMSDEFSKSGKRLRLEYIIARLSGGDGLLCAAEAMCGESEIPDTAENGVALVKKVFTEMIPYVQCVPDKETASLLENEINVLLAKLNTLGV